MGTLAPVNASLRELGGALRLLREQRGIQQQELARLSGTGKSQLSLYERGKQAPNVETLLRLHGALDSDFHALYNAMKVGAGKLEEVCSGRPERREQGAAKKFAEGLAILLRSIQEES